MIAYWAPPEDNSLKSDTPGVLLINSRSLQLIPSWFSNWVALRAMAASCASCGTTKKVFEQNIEIKKFTASSDLSKCHILYIPSGSSEPFSSVVSKMESYSTLIVTDTPGMATKGSAINFVIMANRQKFELNESNAVKYNLKVSNSLEALAILVN